MTIESFDQYGTAENSWYKHADRFTREIACKPDNWLRDSRMKYLNIRIDTRRNVFRVEDRDGREWSPNFILNIPEGKKAKSLFADN